jgi:small basic protein
MKTSIIIIHSIGIVAGVMCAASIPDSVKTWAGIVCAASNGLGVYLSSVYRTGDPDGTLSTTTKK